MKTQASPDRCKCEVPIVPQTWEEIEGWDGSCRRCGQDAGHVFCSPPDLVTFYCPTCGDDVGGCDCGVDLIPEDEYRALLETEVKADEAFEATGGFNFRGENEDYFETRGADRPPRRPR